MYPTVKVFCELPRLAASAVSNGGRSPLKFAENCRPQACHTTTSRPHGMKHCPLRGGEGGYKGQRSPDEPDKHKGPRPDICSLVPTGGYGTHSWPQETPPHTCHKRRLPAANQSLTGVNSGPQTATTGRVLTAGMLPTSRCRAPRLLYASAYIGLAWMAACRAAMASLACPLRM